MSDENTRSRFIAAANFLTAVHGPGFTLQDLYDEANLTKADFRRVFRSKTELLAASGHEGVPVAEIEEPLEREEGHEPIPNMEMEDAGQGESRYPAGPEIAIERETEKPQRATEETKHETEQGWPAGDEHWIDRRFRILERAISSLEIQIADLQSLQKKLSDPAANSEPPPLAETAAFPKEIDLPELPPVVEVPYQPFEPPPLVAGSPAIFAEIPEGKSEPDMTSVSARSRNREREALAAHWSVADETPDHKPSRMIVILALAIMCGILAGILTSTLHAGAGISASKHAAQSAVAVSKPTPVQALLDQANKGDPAAQTKLAIAYMQGAGVKADLETAIHWAEAAASGGDVDAKYLLGALMRAGAKPDLAMAAHWYQEAAEGGNVKAMHNFGLVLLNGTGVPKDEAGAVQWFERAANLGYRDSQFDLAVLYERGEGVSQNPSEALRWYEKAAAAGDIEAAQRATWLRQNVRQLASR